MAVIILRSSLDQAQYEAELDLQMPILFFNGISHIYISPFRLPNPPKHTNLPKLPQRTSFLCCFPNSKTISLFLEKRTGSAGMKPLITKKFSPFLSHEKSWTGPEAVLTLTILLFSSLYKQSPYSPQQDLPVGSQQVCSSIKNLLEVGLNLIFISSALLITFSQQGSYFSFLQSCRHPLLVFLSRKAATSTQLFSVLINESQKNSWRPVLMTLTWVLSSLQTSITLELYLNISLSSEVNLTSGQLDLTQQLVCAFSLKTATTFKVYKLTIVVLPSLASTLSSTCRYFSPGDRVIEQMQLQSTSNNSALFRRSQMMYLLSDPTTSRFPFLVCRRQEATPKI